MSARTGGYAFPIGPDTSSGMTLRDYFAAAAMQGLIAEMEEYHPQAYEAWAKRAYRLADAMIAERDIK